MSDAVLFALHLNTALKWRWNVRRERSGEKTVIADIEKKILELGKRRSNRAPKLK